MFDPTIDCLFHILYSIAVSNEKKGKKKTNQPIEEVFKILDKIKSYLETAKRIATKNVSEKFTFVCFFFSGKKRFEIKISL